MLWVGGGRQLWGGGELVDGAPMRGEERRGETAGAWEEGHPEAARAGIQGRGVLARGSGVRDSQMLTVLKMEGAGSPGAGVGGRGEGRHCGFGLSAWQNRSPLTEVGVGSRPPCRDLWGSWPFPCSPSSCRPAAGWDGGQGSNLGRWVPPDRPGEAQRPAGWEPAAGVGLRLGRTQKVLFK